MPSIIDGISVLVELRSLLAVVVPAGHSTGAQLVMNGAALLALDGLVVDRIALLDPYCSTGALTQAETQAATQAATLID